MSDAHIDRANEARYCLSYTRYSSGAKSDALLRTYERVCSDETILRVGVMQLLVKPEVYFRSMRAAELASSRRAASWSGKLEQPGETAAARELGEHRTTHDGHQVVNVNVGEGAGSSSLHVLHRSSSEEDEDLNEEEELDLMVSADYMRFCYILIVISNDSSIIQFDARS
jgi:hypothetical protein